MVDALIDGFKERGISAVKEPAIRFVGTSGVVIGFPDILVLPPGRKPEVIEVKTGSDPILTPMQALYIPYLQLGNHIYSTDSRITGLGLTPGQPFPQWK